MTADQVIKHYGTANKASAELDIGLQTLRRWEKDNRIPIWSQHAIAHISKDALKVDRVKK